MSLVFVIFIVNVVYVTLCDASLLVSSRIVEGIDKWSTDSVVISSSSSADSNQVSPAPVPDPFSGPINLSFLEGNCFSINQDRWEYVFCSYQNVTSKRIMGQKVNLLGVWGHWSQNSMSDIPNMEFVGGQGCNGEDSFLTGEKSPKDEKETRVSVSLVCDNPTIESVSILSVEENECHYRLRLGLPISCSLLKL